MSDLNSWAEKQLAAFQSVPHTNPLLNPFLYLNRLSLTKWLTRIKLYEMSQNMPGSIVECGVRDGASLMVYYHLSSILTPFNFTQKIIGFDTFTGFPSVSSHDPNDSTIGQESGQISFDELSSWIKIQDYNRPGVGHIPKVELIKGDACLTIPDYVSSNPHLIISMLVLDFDLYEPTKIALQQFLPLMPKGSLVVFDELAQSRWPGETVALKEMLDLNDIKLMKFPFDAHTTYFIVE